MIGILYSEPGCGKSYQALGFEEPLTVFDMENRLEQKINKYFPEKIITNLELKKYDSEYQEDTIGSFNAFEKEIKNLIKNLEKPSTIVIDGIGDLRDYAHAKWCKVEGRKHAVSPGDWLGVNDYVRKSLFPVINWARVHKINLILTAQMKDNYAVIGKGDDGKSVKDGRAPSYKEFCSYNVDFIIELWQPKIKGKIKIGSYMATCIKSETGTWEEDISNKQLYEILIEKGIL